MAKNKKSTLAPKEELNEYKKEIGKQYMDGLISDKEYEILLKNKEDGLGLNTPAPKEDEGPECPSCGALINPHDTECMICGIALEPTLIEKTEELPEFPTSESSIDQTTERACASCGAVVSSADTMCIVCGSTLTDLQPDVLDESDEIPVENEKICQSCGAFVDIGATECMICETPFDTVKEISPTPEELKMPEEGPAMPAIAEEFVCPECGAVLDEGTEECFICGVKIGEEPTVIPIAVPPPEPVEEFIPTEPELSIDDDLPGPEIPEEVPAEEPAMTIAEEFVCPECGAVLDEGTEECFICGVKIGEEPTVIPVATPPPEPVEEIIPTEPEPIPIDDDLPEQISEMPPEAEAESLKVPIEEPLETVEEPEATEEIILGEHEIICPSCSSVIPDDQEKCPECWTDLSLYVRCPECSLLSPAGDNQCRECFAPFEVPETPEPESEYIMDDDGGIPDIHIPDEVEITEELREEMTSLEVQEEQGKECLVCGAIFGPEDLVCPICGIEYGVEVEEPVMPETTWEAMEVEVHPTIHTCPNCSENITGLEATEREINEGKWFYRGLITIFTGIFFTSFSIWARGVSVEEQSLGLHPPPTDIVLNLLGWILVIMGAVFWFMSWRLHDERSECHHCGIETEPGMAICINCGTNLIGEAGEDDEFMDEEIPEEDIPLDETMEAEMPVDEFPQYDENGTMPDIIDDIEQKDMEIPPEMQAEEDMFLPPEGDIQTEEDVFLPQEPEMQAEADMPPETKFTHGEELPTEHEEHKKCPGCGIFVELTDTICPICDTEFGVEAISAEVPSEETEMENIDAKTPRGECPSCGAELESGTKSCPICEYPIDQ